jgi:hypothetical protein
MKPRRRSRVFRRIGAAGSFALASLLTLVAGVAFVSSVANSTYDDQQNRAGDSAVRGRAAEVG